MNTYANQITEIQDTEAKFPKVNSRMSKHFGAKRHKAGMEFLGRLHEEIQEANPNWRKDDEAPQATRKVPLNKLIELKVAAPELSDEYLAKLGIPATLASMSAKPVHGLDVLGGTGEEIIELEEAA